jgi:hypothetical protein
MSFNVYLWYHFGFHIDPHSTGDFIFWLLFGFPIVIAYVALTTKQG